MSKIYNNIGLRTDNTSLKPTWLKFLYEKGVKVWEVALNKLSDEDFEEVMNYAENITRDIKEKGGERKEVNLKEVLTDWEGI